GLNSPFNRTIIQMMTDGRPFPDKKKPVCATGSKQSRTQPKGYEVLQ
ncbi:unnamed protein product, partial [marine sediment metagenome]